MGARNGRNRPAGETRDLRRVRAFYDGNAHKYDRWLVAYERAMGIGAHRDRLLSIASGRVLEAGIGTGRSLSAYPAETQITGVDLSPAMLQIAKTRASDLGRAVDLRTGDIQDLDFPEASFDAVVAILVVSAVPDQHQAISEIKRVLRPEAVRARRLCVERMNERQRGSVIRHPSDWTQTPSPAGGPPRSLRRAPPSVPCDPWAW